MSNRKSNANVCSECGMKDLQTTRKGVCRKCDTSHMGTWYLSCISELDYIIVDDDVLDGYAYGSTGNDFLGLPDGTPIYCHVDKQDKNLFHAFCDENEMEEEDWVNDYDIWWEHPSVTKLDFKVNFKFTLS